MSHFTARCFTGYQLVSTRLMLATLLCGLLLMADGCKRKSDQGEELPEVITNRTHDVEYINALQSQSAKQSLNARMRNEVARQQQACRDRVRLALGSDVSDADLQAALARDSEWQELMLMVAKVEEAEKKSKQDARDLIRDRMISEQQAQQAVKEGRAKSKQTVPIE